jgi:hypothetical protein
LNYNGRYYRAIFDEISEKLRRAAEEATALLPKAAAIMEVASQRTYTTASIMESIQWTETIAAMARSEYAVPMHLFELSSVLNIILLNRYLDKKMSFSQMRYDDMEQLGVVDQAWSSLHHLTIDQSTYHTLSHLFSRCHVSRCPQCRDNSQIIFFFNSS